MEKRKLFRAIRVKIYLLLRVQPVKIRMGIHQLIMKTMKLRLRIHLRRRSRKLMMITHQRMKIKQNKIQ